MSLKRNISIGKIKGKILLSAQKDKVALFFSSELVSNKLFETIRSTTIATAIMTCPHNNWLNFKADRFAVACND